jgi:hypothetical protein
MTIRWQGGMEMARIRKEERHRRTGTGVLILLWRKCRKIGVSSSRMQVTDYSRFSI